MSLNNFIDQQYGQTTEDEELQKQAQIELFAKVAEENGIDLDDLEEEKVAELYEAFLGELEKEAEDDDKDDDDKDEKKDEARQEFAKKKEASEKLAEAEAMGVAMADAYVDRLQKHAAANGLNKEASAPNGTLLQVKQASSIDQLAAQEAFNKVASHGFDTNQAESLLNAVLTLGPSESQKVASASTVEEAIDLRSLELLEMAGYPVNYG